MSVLYELKATFAKSEKDRMWLEDKKTWTTIPDSTLVPFLEEYARECTGPLSDGDLAVDRMREMISATLKSMTLGTLVRASPDDVVRVQVGETFGCISHDTWLNDSVVFLALRTMAFRHTGVHVVDPLGRGHIKAPAGRLRDQRLIVFPLNFDNVHWCAVFVILDWSLPTKHEALVYDPQCRGGWEKALERSWLTWIKPLLHAWNDEDKTDHVQDGGFIDSIQKTIIHSPRQRDGHNCAVFCIAVAHALMLSDPSIREVDTFSTSQLKVMRLRIMYMCLLKSRKSTNDSEKLRSEETKAQFGSFGVAFSGGRKMKRKRR
jgi:hypothetical protein